MEPIKLMSNFQIRFFADLRGNSPVIDWLKSIPKRAHAKGIAIIINRLAVEGYQIKRPESAYLEDKIYELRWDSGGNQYRILYFLFDNEIVLTNGFQKKTQKVPESEIEKAKRYRQLYLQNPDEHTFEKES